jgi:hypothetical protein
MQNVAPVIVVTRHPDYSDEITLHGVEADVVYIDLGSQFDTTPNDEEEARDWAEGVWSELRDLPADHPARDEVEEIIGTTVENYFTVEREGTTLKLHEVAA